MTETVTVIKKEPTCAELVDEQWRERQEDLKDPEYEALGFDYVEPHTFNDQPEGYWRWQFSWGGPSDELRGYVNEHAELHRLEYWYLDWGDGASIAGGPGRSCLDTDAGNGARIMILLIIALLLLVIVGAAAAFLAAHVFLVYFCITFVLVFLGII